MNERFKQSTMTASWAAHRKMPIHQKKKFNKNLPKKRSNKKSYINSNSANASADKKRGRRAVPCVNGTQHWRRDRSWNKGKGKAKIKDRSKHNYRGNGPWYSLPRSKEKLGIEQKGPVSNWRETAALAATARRVAETAIDGSMEEVN